MKSICQDNKQHRGFTTVFTPNTADFPSFARGSTVSSRSGPPMSIGGLLGRSSFAVTFLAVVGVACVSASFAGPQTSTTSSHSHKGQTSTSLGPPPALLNKCRQRAIDFLRTTQANDGSWTAPSAPGITALCTIALMQNGVSVKTPVVERALSYLTSQIKKDGGIYFAQTNHRNYETCLAMLAFQAANHDGRYNQVIANAEKFLKHLQWDEGEGLETSDTGYGGAGYGSHERPDLSNTQFLVEALKAAGVQSNDPAMQKALLFVSRCQNLEGEHNTTPFAAKINDGGFYYTPAAGGTSQAGSTPNGGLRSYGSMTYAGLKSMIYAGLTPEDERVKAAFEWIKRFYTVEDNPGMGKQGLFYYYHTLAKTLSVLNVDRLEDSKGIRHDWRRELTQTLANRQKPNGSWINEAKRWYEGDPNLVTAYALLALSYCVEKPVATAH